MDNSSKENDQWKLVVLFLKKTAEEKAISNYEIAKNTGYSQSTIGRVFKLGFCPKIKIVLSISECIGVDIINIPPYT